MYCGDFHFLFSKFLHQLLLAVGSERGIGCGIDPSCAVHNVNVSDSHAIDLGPLLGMFPQGFGVSKNVLSEDVNRMPIKLETKKKMDHSCKCLQLSNAVVVLG